MEKIRITQARRGTALFAFWLLAGAFVLCSCVASGASRGTVQVEVLDGEFRPDYGQPPQEYVFDVNSWLPESEKGIMYSFAKRHVERSKKRTQRILQNATSYLPMIQPCLAEHGLPPELAALPFIESAFQYDAVSSAGAGGLWQFMPTTARKYGLVVNNKVDERYDVVKSSHAAARYLAFLYDTFGEWPLALTAYNCGEKRLLRALKASNTSTLAELTQYCRSSPNQKLLTEETLQFVARFTAAVTVMSNSREYGLADVDVLNLNPPGGTYRALNP